MLWGRNESAQGGAPLAWVWGARDRALSHARPPVLGACGQGPLPTDCGYGACGRGDPSPTPQRVLLPSGFARCGGSTREPGRGGLLLGAGRPRLGALSRRTARPWGVRPRPTTQWLWVWGVLAWGPVTNSTGQAVVSWLCALWGGTRVLGGGRILPGCGASTVGCSATPNRPSLGRAAGACYPLAVGAGAVGLGTRHQSHSARSCELASSVVERHEGGWGRRLLPGCRGSAVGPSPTPILGPCGRGPLPTGYGWEGCGLRDPSPTPQRALLQADFARRGGGTRAPRGGASCLRVGRPGLGGLPRPTARPWGVRPGPTTHWLWVRGLYKEKRLYSHFGISLCKIKMIV